MWDFYTNIYQSNIFNNFFFKIIANPNSVDLFVKSFGELPAVFSSFWPIAVDFL